MQDPYPLQLRDICAGSGILKFPCPVKSYSPVSNPFSPAPWFPRNCMFQIPFMGQYSSRMDRVIAIEPSAPTGPNKSAQISCTTIRHSAPAKITPSHEEGLSKVAHCKGPTALADSTNTRCNAARGEDRQGAHGRMPDRAGTTRLQGPRSLNTDLGPQRDDFSSHSSCRAICSCRSFSPVVACWLMPPSPRYQRTTMCCST